MSSRVTIKYFGQIAEAVGKSEEHLRLSFSTVEKLIADLTTLYPGLTTQEFNIAIDQQIVEGVITSKTITEIAVLPPFAGG